MDPRRKVLVIGGTLFIGKELVSSLMKAGHEVTILHRAKSHKLGVKVASLIADRNDSAAVAKVIDGQKFDAVFDCVYDWERGTTGAQVEATARLFGGQIQRYVFISSVAAYGSGLNHYEGDGLAPDDHPDAYARNKAMSERALFRLHQRYGFPAVTIRPAFVYGAGNPFYREQFFWDRMRDGRRLILPGDGRRLMQFVYVKDVAAACLAALEQPAAVGHAFNLCNGKAIAQAELIDALARAAAKRVEAIRIPRELIMRMGGNPFGPNYYFGQYLDLPPITMMVAKAQRVLKFRATEFAEGLKETYKWWKSEAQNTALDYSFEDKLLSRADAGIAGT